MISRLRNDSYRFLAYSVGAACATALLGGCQSNATQNAAPASSAPAPSTMASSAASGVSTAARPGVQVSEQINQSLTSAAVSFGQKWPPHPELLTTGGVILRDGKWYRYGPSRMVIQAQTIEKGSPSTGDYVAHILYEQQCKQSDPVTTREKAAAAPLSRAGSGVINVNFSCRSGKWTYLNGV